MSANPVDGLSEMVRSDCGLPQEAFPGKCRARTRSAPLKQLNPNASLLAVESDDLGGLWNIKNVRRAPKASMLGEQGILYLGVAQYQG